MQKYVTLICECCGKEYQVKVTRTCSRSCGSKVREKKKGEQRKPKRGFNPAKLF